MCAIGNIPAVCAKLLSSPFAELFVLPTQEGRREKKSEIEQGKDTISPWMFWEHRNMDPFTGAEWYTKEKPLILL